jgi:hypothetical protein
MRALAFAALLVTGCLSAPTGRDPGMIDAGGDGGTDGDVNLWPPPAANIVAVTAADMDTDGKDDLIAVDAGNARVFLLRGGVDIDPARAAVTTVSDSAPLVGLRGPVAVTVATNANVKYIVVLDNPASGARITTFNAQLDMVGQVNAGPPAATANAIVTITQTTFGMGMAAVFGSVPDAVFFFEGNQLPLAAPQVMMLPETGATAFAQVLAIGGFVAPGPVPRVFVSEPTFAQRADTTGPGQFNWSTIRPAASPWAAQATADITGDTYPDVVGFAPEGTNPADICVLDVQGGSAPACYDTQFGMDTASLVVGPVVAAAQNDVILAHVNPGMPNNTAVFVVARLRISGTVMADSFSPPAMFPIVNGLLALAQLDTAGKEILVVGNNGAIQCARSNGGAPVPCS